MSTKIGPHGRDPRGVSIHPAMPLDPEGLVEFGEREPRMPKNPLKDNMKADRTSLGVWANDPETVELCAFLGFDWIMIDMMFTGMDFRDVQNMIRTCEAAGITPVVRMHTNPWAGH